MAVTAADAFREALKPGVDNDIDLIRAATTLGLIAEPALDVEATVARFEALALEVVAEVPRFVSLQEGVKELNLALFKRRGFHGNRDQYDDPRNCFVHELLSRRTGIPITLSLLYVVLGRRLGLPLAGVGFPAHFVVRAGDDPVGYLYLDPFNEGLQLSRDDLALLLRRQGGDPDRQLEGFLAAVTPRQLLARILNNVEGMYHRRRQLSQTREAIELQLVIAPWALEKLRDRGLISAQLGDLEPATVDLSAYLEHEPNAGDFERVSRILAEVKRRLA